MRYRFVFAAAATMIVGVIVVFAIGDTSTAWISFVTMLGVRRQNGRGEGLPHEVDEVLCHGIVEARPEALRERRLCCGGASPRPVPGPRRDRDAV